MHFCHKAPGVISLFKGEGYIMALEKSLLACCAEVTLLLEKKNKNRQLFHVSMSARCRAWSEGNKPS